MTRAIEMLGRLYPPAARLDFGEGRGASKGGVTPQDIAAALAFVRDPMGADLLRCMLEPGDSTHRRRLIEQLAAAQRTEQLRTWIDESKAKLDLHIASETVAAVNAPTHSERSQVDRARAAMERAKAAAWPNKPEMMPKLRLLAIRELCAPRTCPECEGQQWAKRPITVSNIPQKPEPPTPCEKCGGRGTIPTSEAQRAGYLGRDHSSYSRTWAKVFDWTMDLLRNCFEQSKSEYHQALRDE